MSSNFYCINLELPTRIFNTLLAKLMLVLVFLLTLSQPVLAENWRDQLPQAKEIGQGELRWFGFKIYTAKLWSEHQQFNQNEPFALELTYHRSISREQFVQASMDEIKRLSGTRFSVNKLHDWEMQLNRVFPNVVEGDQLIGLYQPQHGCRFYGKNTLLGDIADVELAQAFFAIWLDPRTKDSELRAHLLGVEK